MKNTWKKFEDWLSTNFIDGLNDLNTSISDDELNALIEAIGCELPEDFVTFLKIHNGQLNEAGGLINATELLSSTRIIDEWSCWKGLLDSGEFTDSFEERSNGVKPDWWNKKWIPFTYNGAGDHLCIDLDPAPGGSYGQVITMWHDDDEREVLATSFKAWFNSYVNDTLNGKYVYDEEYECVVSIDDI